MQLWDRSSILIGANLIKTQQNMPNITDNKMFAISIRQNKYNVIVREIFCWAYYNHSPAIDDMYKREHK